jgi:hypothetical protein
MRERGVQHAELKVLEEAARSWSLALDLCGRGEFGQAMSALDRIPKPALERFKLAAEMRKDLKARQREFEGLLSTLHHALEKVHWREVIQVADQVLAIAPEHAEARKVRARAWRAVEPPTLSLAGMPRPARHVPEAEAADGLPRRMILWVDGVGGYLLCLSKRVSFGQATPDAYVDVPILADISRLHGYLTRDAEGYLLEAVRPVTVNHKPVEKALLREGDRLTLGGSCQIVFRQPLAVSGTARLDIVSGHRLPLSVDGVILMADACILGPAGAGHLILPELNRPIVLFRRKDGLGVRAGGDLTVDGAAARDKAVLRPNSTVTGDDFRFTLEPVGPQFGVVAAR